MIESWMLDDDEDDDDDETMERENMDMQAMIELSSLDWACCCSLLSDEDDEDELDCMNEPMPLEEAEGAELAAAELEDEDESDQ
jgi:hypothetical protein